jgi:hypothetical protein
MNDYFWAEKFIEIIADVEVECSQCDLQTAIVNAELAGNRDNLYLEWLCQCGHKNYSELITTDFIDER